MFSSTKLRLPEAADALPGRDTPIVSGDTHFVNGRRFLPPYPEGLEIADVALGCFWGAERLFWEIEGVWVTAVGYQGGFTRNPTYQEVCSGRTGHAEAVRIVFDPKTVGYAELLKTFFENHDPTQGMRQGNDVGTQYRSAIYAHSDAQRAAAETARAKYAEALAKMGYGAVTTDIEPAPAFYFAEEHHQQYLAKNPGGYCGLAGTGVNCPVGVGAKV
jgi:peptide-methionine (S)-S-oxide reductase